MATGASVHYVSGNGHRPIPLATDQPHRGTHTPAKPKPKGLDWDALTPTGKCGHKSTRLNRDDLCPSCAAPGTANNPDHKAKAAECEECGRTSRFLHDGRCPICAAETTQLVLDQPPTPDEPPTGNVASPAPQNGPAVTADHAAPDAQPPLEHTTAEPTTPPAPAHRTQDPPPPNAWPSRPERIWDILIATEDCSGDPIAAMMRRAAIAALEALWLHWRLNHPETTTAHPTPQGDAAAGDRPADASPPVGRPRLGQPLPEDDILSAYQAGTPIGQLATQHNTTPARIRRLADRAGITRTDGRSRNGGRNALTLTPDQEQQLVDGYLAGETFETLSIRLGRDRRALRRILVTRGIEIRPPAHQTHPTLDQPTIDGIITSYAAGATLSQLAHRHGVSTTRLRKILLEHNITPRTKDEALRAHTQRITALGLTQADIKTWAHEQGLAGPPSRGSVTVAILEAYLNAHPHITDQELSS